MEETDAQRRQRYVARMNAALEKAAEKCEKEAESLEGVEKQRKLMKAELLRRATIPKGW